MKIINLENTDYELLVDVLQLWCDYVEVCMKGGADLLL